MILGDKNRPIISFEDSHGAALWIAAGSAAGLDLTREFLEKRVVEPVVPLVIDRIAVKVGAELAEKWMGRVLPVVSAGTAAVLNYYFIRAWGRRAQSHFLARRRALSGREPSARALPSSSAQFADAI